MSEHTPGPWFCTVVPQDADDPEKGGVYVHNNMSTIAVCDVSKFLTPDEHFANGLLCMAAPDLLAACEAAHTLIARLEDEWHYMTPEGQQLRAAIAKAQGGAR